MTLRLRPHVGAPAEARRFVRSTCAARLPEPVVYDAGVCTSEIVTNAVRHSREMLTVAVACDEARVCVAVHDDGGAFEPGQPALAQAHNESGRGLQIVAALARSWGVKPGRGGKTIWFAL